MSALRLHRIALAEYSATAAATFSGAGGLYGHGRWHTQGRPIVYTSEHISLAMAEALVHLQRSNTIAPFSRWEIEVPGKLIADAPALPKNWVLDVRATQAIGDHWLEARASAALCVPSAVVPGEMNCLINPAHPSFSLSWVVAGPIPFSFDSRLTRP